MESRILDDVFFTAIMDKRLRPELAQDFDLLLDPPSACFEALSQGVILNIIPPQTHTEAQPPAAKHIDLCGLLCNKRGLPLREDEDSCRELKTFRHRREET